MKQYASGATRNNSEHKLAHHGFNSAICDRSYAEYMHKHRIQADGKIRDPDNWQKGIDEENYLDSMYRHMQDLRLHRAGVAVYCPDDGHEVGAIELLNAIEFNVKGLKYELLLKKLRIPRTKKSLDTQDTLT